jgi:hypothetical protein
MNAFAYSSYKHRSDQDLLDRLGRAIFVLKLQAQDRLLAYGLGTRDADDGHAQVEQFLDDLGRCTSLLILEPVDDPEGVNMAFTGLADRFVDVNPADVSDRVAELIRLRDRLDREPDAALKERDFRLLDGIQALLEQETAEGVRGLYAF